MITPLQEAPEPESRSLYNVGLITRGPTRLFEWPEVITLFQKRHLALLQRISTLRAACFPLIDIYQL